MAHDILSTLHKRDRQEGVTGESPVRGHEADGDAYPAAPRLF